MNKESLASRQPTEPANSLSAGNLETLEYLHRAIELTDTFALFFARCDQPAQRDALIARLEERLARQGRFGYRQADLYRLTSRPRTARQRLREARPLVRRLRDNSLKSRSQDILRSLDAGLEAKDV